MGIKFLDVQWYIQFSIESILGSGQPVEYLSQLGYEGNEVFAAQEVTMEYQSLRDIPDAYQYLFRKLLRNGLIKPHEDGELHISHDMFEIIVLMARLGLLQ